MKLSTQKRLAASVLKISKKRVILNPERLEDVKEAITKTDIRGLIGDKAITKKPVKGNSKARIREKQSQKKKGLRKGPSTKKGKRTARVGKKDTWMKKVRTQRLFIKELRESKLIDPKTFTVLYLKVKGNFFRSKRHIKIYLEDNDLFKNKK